MLTSFHAAKGGVGTTTVAALSTVAHRGPVLAVDLDDELSTVLGIPPTERPGVLDWLASDAPLEHLSDLVVDVDGRITVLPTRQVSGEFDRGACRALPDRRLDRWMQLASWCRSQGTRTGQAVLIDVGTRRPPNEFVAACDERLLVTRSCYLALRAAQRHPTEATGVVLVTEPGRSLRRSDVEQATGVPVAAELAWDPAVARTVDAGILAGGRTHRATMRELGRLTHARPSASAA